MIGLEPIEQAAREIVASLSIDPSLKGQVEAGLSAFELEGLSLEDATRRWVEVFLEARTPKPDFDDAGRRLLEPIVYERVEHGWRVPRSDRADWDALKRQRDAHTGVYASQASHEAEPPRDPFSCPQCGGPVSGGWTYCSKMCRLIHQRERRRLC